MDKHTFNIKVQAHCLGCKRSDRKHHARGYCRQCYGKVWYKEQLTKEKEAN